MRGRLGTIYSLGIKELYSLRSDPVLIVLLIWVFTFAIYEIATNAKMEVENASVAIVDEDGSLLSRRIADGFLPPYFKPAVQISADQIDPLLDAGNFIFIVSIPPQFESDLLKGEKPEIQLNVDATAMSVAGNGANYAANIINQEVMHFLQKEQPIEEIGPLKVVVRAAFNPNLNSTWFMAVSQIINNVTVMSILLTGAALIREREHGTIEHLLVMPVRPTDIMISKIWANGLVILVATALSLTFVVEGLMNVTITGSTALFLLGAGLYLYSVTALGILLATLATSMPQFGLLAIPVFVVMELLSGGMTPLESMPGWLQWTMQLSPSTHYVSFSQAVLFRDAGFEIIWPQALMMFVIGSVFFAFALRRFRKAIVS
ncbi:ABC transporter permease [Sneathiella limimaris]|uniref:ABC transporter permease n=1 Tax=Sneathiella limimaris TaxID=1964213 RepID=UPI00146ADF87|nr:ABC transporter permease [Sneathiella limimaris]